MFNNKGFLFIEGGLVVVAGIGVVAAAIFPSMTAYLQRSRDAARMSHVMQISTALGAYYADTLSYPDADSSGCIPESLSTYLPRGIPTDPSQKISDGCDGSDGMTYAYRTFYNEQGRPAFAIGANLERPNAGNSAKSIAEYNSADFTQMMNSLSRGRGEYYIFGN